MGKKKYFKVNSKRVPIYVGKLVLVITNDKKKVRKMFPNVFYEGEEPYGHSIEADFGGWRGFHVILNFDHSRAKVTHGIISHEVYHITSFIADRVGVLHDPDNDEPMAYLNGWIADQIYKWIDKQGFKVNIHGR